MSPLVPNPKYSLFDNVDQMLAPETLSELISQPVTQVNCRPVSEHAGVAGSRMFYVDTDDVRLVLKLMSLEHDWVMYASGDLHNRSLRLWEYGILDRMSPYLQHKIIACAEYGKEAAVLMHDLTDQFLTEDTRTPKEVTLALLDTLARHHAAFWGDPILHDPRLGLCKTENWLNISSFPLAQAHPGEQRGFIPGWVREGRRLMAEHLETDVFCQFSRLRDNPQPLLDRMARYPKTLLHGDYASRNLAYEAPDSIVIDWQSTGPGLMTVDLIWFADDQREIIELDHAIHFYRTRLENYLNQRFEDDEWEEMVRLGELTVSLMMICFPVLFSHWEQDPARRNYYEREAREHSRRIRDSIRWLNGARE